MDAEYANYYVREVTAILVKEFSNTDEEVGGRSLLLSIMFLY